jgi:ATP-dependent Clp protease ATP-binding subunit ClpC
MMGLFSSVFGDSEQRQERRAGKGETESMVERFTEHARRTVFFARYEASSAGSAYVEPQHLLLALLREAKPLFGLWSLDGPEAVRSIRAEVETAFPPKVNWEPGGQLPLSERGKRIFDYAIEEARHMGTFHIDTGHLLLGILREENAPGAGAILQGRGLLLPLVRQKIAGA